MKEHPIIFNSASIQAILEGRKTQTRRVIKPQPELKRASHNEFVGALNYYWKTHECFDIKAILPRYCPYGQVGQRLWVKETWGRGLKQLWYKADWDSLKLRDNIRPLDITLKDDKWKSPLFMPRWASRITLEITGLRVERLQEITWQDAKAEGAHIDYRAPLMQYRILWDSLNAKRGYGWGVNPWVWVIEFKTL